MSVDFAAAVAYQQLLRERVVLSGDLTGADLIAGADTASWPRGLYGRWNRKYGSGQSAAVNPTSNIQSPKSELIHAAIVIWRLSRQKVIASATASVPASFPYIPGLLAFREMPALLEAWPKLPTRPDVVICDGQGIAHPRRCGIACHLGVELGVPAVGCAKSRLCGWYEEPGLSKGDWAELREGADIAGIRRISIPHSTLPTPHWEVIGRVVRTRRNVSPVFVSPGHLCDIEGAMALALTCATRYRLPEPIRAAHAAAGLLLHQQRQL